MSTSQRAKTSSTIILKTKAFPPINGKKRPFATYSGIKGIMKSPVIMLYLNILVIVFWFIADSVSQGSFVVKWANYYGISRYNEI
jgi:hypothetical protein